MRLLVASDIHGSLYYANKLSTCIDREIVDGVILLGDLYYHGPRNALPKDYSPMEVCDILNRYKDMILSAKGNCDAEVDVMMSRFPFSSSIRKTIKGRRFMFTHGHKYNIDNPPNDIDVLIYGHTHIPFVKRTKEGKVYANPGSVSIPKGDSVGGYMIVSDYAITLKDLDGNTLDTLDL